MENTSFENMRLEQQDLVLRAGEGARVGIGGDVYTIVAAGRETAGQYAVVSGLVFPGGGPPPHIHRREQESIFVLEGELTVYREGEAITGGPGTFVNLPMGKVHNFRNNTDQNVRMLVYVTPSGLEEYFLEIGVPVEDPNARVRFDEGDLRRLLEGGAKYGLEFPLAEGAAA